MNKTTHLMIGKLLCEQVKQQFGIILHEKSFLFGNILPDIGVKFLIRPHFFNNHRKQLKKRLHNLLQDTQTSVYFGRRYSKNLGIICHYYADFFCYPHQDSYRGDLADHVLYERALLNYLLASRIDIPCCGSVRAFSGDISADGVFDRLLSFQASYALIEPSFQNDMSHALRVCLDALVLITGTVLVEQEDAIELCTPA
ncbi:zinc dependent phospholipase C family protein [Oscillospiraceae bacterium WX1]